MPPVNSSQYEQLSKAVFDDDADEVRRLVESGAQFAAHPKHGNTLLRTACQRDALRALRALLEMGGDPNERITYRSPVDKRVEECFTPLMYVTSAAAAEILVEFGANLNATSTTGLTALMRHAHFGSAEIIETLLRHGADTTLRRPKQRGRKPLSALEFAEDGLDFWLSLPKEHLKPGAETVIARHRRTVELLRAASSELPVSTAIR
jgi:ankyrin repeat protein